MTIFEVLRRKHQEIDAAFEDIEGASSIADARARFHELATQLLGCLRAERAVLYPRIARVAHDTRDPDQPPRVRAGATDDLGEALQHHAAIERAVDRVRITATDDELRAELRAVRTLVAELAATEEWEVFPLASLAITTPELRALATEFLARQPLAVATAGATITYDSAAA